MPVGAGEVVLGRIVERRCIHSIRTAAVETGLHQQRLRRLLMEAGVVAPEAPHKAGGRVNAAITFRAADAEVFFKEAADQLSLAEAGEHINAPRVQIKLLADSGLLEGPGGSKGGKKRALTRAALDRFLCKLAARSGGETEAGGDVQNLPVAAHRANCGVIEIVRLVLDGRLSGVGSARGVTGYMAVLVSLDEVKRHVRGADLDGLAVAHLTGELGINWKVAYGLVRSGVLKTQTRRHPVHRASVEIVTWDNIAAFKRDYATLYTLAKEWGCHFTKVTATLSRLGVVPCLKKEQVGCTIYRRADVASALVQAAGGEC